MSLTKKTTTQEANTELQSVPIGSTSTKELNNEPEPAPIDRPPVLAYEGLSVGDKVLLHIAFITCGMSGLIFAKMIYSSSVALKLFWPGQVFTSLLLACEGTTGMCIGIIMFFFNGLNVNLVYIGGAAILLATILFPAVAITYSGLEHFHTGKILLICLCLLAGVGSGFFSVVSMSYAAVMPFANVIPIGSCGLSVTGVITFCSYLLLSVVAFPQTIEGQKPLLWSFFSIGACIVIIQIVSFAKLNRKRWFRSIVDKAILNADETVCWSPFSSMKNSEVCWKPFNNSVKNPKLDRELTQTKVLAQVSKEHVNDGLPVYKPNSTKQGSNDSNDTLRKYRQSSSELIAKANNSSTSSNIDINDDSSDKSHPPPRHIKHILRDCGLHVFTASLTLFLSCLMSPYPGPQSWNQEYTMETCLLGTVQVCNAFFKYSPAWRFLRIQPKWLLPIVCMRIVFIPLFFTPSRFAPTSVFWRHPATLIMIMVLYTAFHGWSITLACMYSTSSVENPKEKAIIGKVIVVCLSITSTVGYYSSGLLKLF